MLDQKYLEFRQYILKGQLKLIERDINYINSKGPGRDLDSGCVAALLILSNQKSLLSFELTEIEIELKGMESSTAGDM